MMELTDLPPEIIMLIIRKLDFRSQLSLYNTCKSFRDIACTFKVITECNMSMNNMASVNTLKLNFFKKISNHLLTLNMRGVPDLCKTTVLPAFKKLKCLKTLDISYTNLNIHDLIQLHRVCPTLKDITVNFVFGQADSVKITQNMMLKYQSLFENFENVHFVGSLNNLLYFKLPVYILEKAKLHNLKLSAVEVDNVHTPIFDIDSECQMPYFNHLAVYLINWKTTCTYEYLSRFPVLSMIEVKKYNYFIINVPNTSGISVYGTSVFKQFFCENFNITLECVTNIDRSLMGNIVLMLWNKETTKFDDTFFNYLYKHVKQYFPYYLKTNSNIITVPQKYDWFYIEPIEPEVPSEDDEDEDIVCACRRKKRRTMANIMLNDDGLFKDKPTLQLSFVFNTRKIAAIIVQRSYDYLKKVTFLNLSGIAYYPSNFFKIVFQSCEYLETLSVESSSLSPCTPLICRFIYISQSLRNIHLIDRSIKFNDIFTSFADCPTLENIQLLDLRQWEHYQPSDPSLLLEKCPNLYCVMIEAPFPESTKLTQLKEFCEAKTKFGRHHCKVVINHLSNRTFKYNYDPFLDVFKLNPLKPI